MTNDESDPVAREIQRFNDERAELVREAMADPRDQEFYLPSQVQTADDLRQRLTTFLNALDAQEDRSHAEKLRLLVALDGQFQTLFREAITHQAEAIEHEANST